MPSTLPYQQSYISKQMAKKKSQIDRIVVRGSNKNNNRGSNEIPTQGIKSTVTSMVESRHERIASHPFAILILISITLSFFPTYVCLSGCINPTGPGPPSLFSHSLFHHFSITTSLSISLSLSLHRPCSPLFPSLPFSRLHVRWSHV